MILDTSAYSALRQGKTAIVELTRGADQLVIPLPVIAELRYGFAYGSRPQENEDVLLRFLAQEKTSVLQPTVATTQLYALVAAHCKRAGRALSHNDIWIAALAQESGLVLATYDKDFTALAAVLGDKLVVLE